MTENSYIDYINTSNINKKGSIIFFNASWCVPCTRMKKNINEYADFFNNNNINVLKIDIDTNKDQYNKDTLFFQMLKKKRIVKGVPSLLYYCNEGMLQEDVYPDYFIENNQSHFNSLIELIKHK